MLNKIWIKNCVRWGRGLLEKVDPINYVESFYLDLESTWSNTKMIDLDKKIISRSEVYLDNKLFWNKNVS